jgi:RNA polymerase sigma factor (sigma-70 family)
MQPIDDATDIFETHRTRLLRIAYRMLGSRSEAEDVVQNAWLRWVAADRKSVAAPYPFLARVVTRLCLDEMKSARARRETYVGAWLPEPLVEAEEDGLAEDDLTLTLMMALERLSPLERAAFLLHDVFGVPLGEVADTLDREAAAVRQLAVRARRNIQAARPRFPVEREEGERIARAFFAASTSGDTAILRTLLAENVVLPRFSPRTWFCAPTAAARFSPSSTPSWDWTASCGCTRVCAENGGRAGRRCLNPPGSTGCPGMSAASAATSSRPRHLRSKTAGSRRSTLPATLKSFAASRRLSPQGRTRATEHSEQAAAAMSRRRAFSLVGRPCSRKTP